MVKQITVSASWNWIFSDIKENECLGSDKETISAG
jgi:hypothetical protein